MARGLSIVAGTRAGGGQAAGGAINLSSFAGAHHATLLPDRRGAWFATSLASCALVAAVASAGMLATQGSNDAAATVPVHVDLRPLSEEFTPVETARSWPAPVMKPVPASTGSIGSQADEAPIVQRHSPVARAARMAMLAAGFGETGPADKPAVVPGAPVALRLSSLADTVNTTTLVRRPPVAGQAREVEHAVVVAAGDTLYDILDTYDVSAPDAIALARALGEVFAPQDLKVGQELSLTVREETDGSAVPLALSLQTGERDITVALTGPKTYEARVDDVPLAARELRRALASIEGSLYGTARAQDVPDSIIVRMMRTHSYDVDFQREIKAGDTFEVFYSAARPGEGGPSGNTGQLLFSSLTTGGETRSYYRFTAEDGTTDYYNADGLSSKKPLMRTPINGARISSNFGMRMHPIAGYTRMHGGVDFAAPTGTPILAAGDGTVEVARTNGGYGNYIRIRHQDGIETAYAHLSRFAKGLASGRRVRQGDVIGFVGTTGASTGPHLHYEVHVNGEKQNPLTVKVAGGGRQLEGDEFAAFEAERDRIDQLRAKSPVEALVAAARP